MKQRFNTLNEGIKKPNSGWKGEKLHMMMVDEADCGLPKEVMAKMFNDAKPKPMTDQEILVKAINKAAPFEWDGYTLTQAEDKKHSVQVRVDYYEPNRGKSHAYMTLTASSKIAIIFSHGFLKAFFGEDKLTTDDIDVGWYVWMENTKSMELDCDAKKWQYHAQQMVIQENPIQYLNEYL